MMPHIWEYDLGIDQITHAGILLYPSLSSHVCFSVSDVIHSSEHRNELFGAVKRVILQVRRIYRTPEGLWRLQW